MASFKKADPPGGLSHPFRSFSPSSEPPKSLAQEMHEEQHLIQLLQAIQAHDLQRIEGLLSTCPDINFALYEVKPLVYAAWLGQLDTIQLFETRGADLHRPGKLPVFIFDKTLCFNEHDRSLTPLEAAEAHRHDDIVEFLKKKMKK